MIAFQGRAGRLPPDEQQLILDAANRYGIDPVFLAAIRIAENGGPGREFGVLSVPAPTIYDQADVAARSVRNGMTRYWDDTGVSPTDANGRLTREFIRHFAARWAPVNAANDPTGLNNYWVANVNTAYFGSSVIV